MKDYLRLLCSNEYKEEMKKTIEDYGYTIKPSYPLQHLNASGEVAFWIFELDVIFNVKDDKQNELLKLQDKSLGL